MSNLPDDRKVLLINIPCAHDSAANLVDVLGESVAKTQNLNITELLRAGIRKLDIRYLLVN